MSRIFDNQHLKLKDELAQTLEKSERIDICVGYFNLRGWDAIDEYIEKMSGATITEDEEPIHRTCRLLIGMQRTQEEILKTYYGFQKTVPLDQTTKKTHTIKLAEEFRKQLQIGLPTIDSEKTLQLLSRQLKSGKVAVKLYLKHNLHAKLYLAYQNHHALPVLGYLGSSNLTLAGLDRQGELNTDITDDQANQQLVQWFENRWDDNDAVDISRELAQVIDESWARELPIPPYHIYLKMIWHLSREAIDGIRDFKVPEEFRGVLLPFQEVAVRIAAQYLNKRGGVLVGDVVGLGKTMTAAAIAKIFENDQNLETLILCPPNLVDMWEKYKIEYRLRAHVMSQGKMQDELEKFPRYRVVIIDESHNLRNHESVRWNAVKTYIDRNESKVILLSATPYNKDYTDLSNQLRLFIADDEDLGFSPEHYIASLGGAHQFGAQHPDTGIRTIRAFEKSFFADDWSELMKLYLLRRTRSFIKSKYAKKDVRGEYLEFSDGRKSYFPKRTAKRLGFRNQNGDSFPKLYDQTVVQKINTLLLPRYGLAKYVNSTIAPQSGEETILANLTKAGQRLRGFCKTNLFKRLESSGWSFLLSVYRHLLRNYTYLCALESGKPIFVGTDVSMQLDGLLDDEDIDEAVIDCTTRSFSSQERDYQTAAENLYRQLTDELVRKGKYSGAAIRAELFTKDLARAMRHDNEALLSILALVPKWDPATDRQLQALYKKCSGSHKNEKILVFTQFADTARYLAEELCKAGINKELIGCVTGGSNPVQVVNRFSPKSNKFRLKSGEKELRILITTDTLSEGQNLQDCRIVVNYDLPWAIIRLVQRAGRVDRIGQEASEILCYSVMPDDGLEQVLNLRRTLTSRLEENAEVVGCDEQFFSGHTTKIKNLFNEDSGVLDEEGEDETDIASKAYQIWEDAIVRNAQERRRDSRIPDLHKEVTSLPDVVYSTKEHSEEGVIVYARTHSDYDQLAMYGKDGELITQKPWQILTAAACEPGTPVKMPHRDDHHTIVRKAVDQMVENAPKSRRTLGKASSVRYRVFTRLDGITQKTSENTLFYNVDDLKMALHEISNFPMKEHAKDILNRQLRSGICDEDLAQLVVALRKENKLCNIEEGDEIDATPRILCSLGMKGS